VSDRYPPYFTGGYEIACQAVVERLRTQGHDPTVLASNYGLQGRTATEDHVCRLLHRPQDSPSLLELAHWEIADNHALRGTMRDVRPEVIYAWSQAQLFPSLHATMRESGVPVVHALHDLWIPNQLEEGERLRQAWLRQGSGPFKSAAKWVLRRFLRYRDAQWLRPVGLADLDLGHAIFCSRFRQAQHAAVGLPIRESRVVYNGIDLDRFCGPRAREGSGLRVLFVGRLVREKGLHTVIEALSHLDVADDVRLTVLGVAAHPFEYADDLRARVAEAGLSERVEFRSPLPNDAMPNAYHEHDVLVFPSAGDEGLPMALIEAMACGLAVATTLTGGSPEIVTEGETGLAFPAGDSVALADRLRRLAQDPPLRRQLAAAGQARARERFGIERAARETLEFLAAAAGSPAPRQA
jgi:glycosyltransferase involved in cell wall biosynthesis